MTNRIRLTPRQREILAFIERSVQRNGAPPTRAEIAAEFGFRSANAAEEHLRALARKGAIELVSGTSRGIRLRLPAAAERGPRRCSVPLIGRVAAGAPILAQEHVEQIYELDLALFPRPPDYLLRVRGHSMRDAGILDGDLLAVQRAQVAQPGAIVVARLDDEVTVKRFYPATDHITLRAENPAFNDIVVRAGEPFAIEGLVIGLVRAALA